MFHHQAVRTAEAEESFRRYCLMYNKSSSLPIGNEDDSLLIEENTKQLVYAYFRIYIFRMGVSRFYARLK